jgi:hypothetical protein
MKPTDQVGVTFVNAVTGRGILNNVVNVQLGVLNFDRESEGKINTDLVPACRLRMDKMCAKQLRDCLDDLLTMIDKAEAHTGVAANGDARESLN